MDKKQFEISLNLRDADSPESLLVNHTDETFRFNLKGKEISIINNGDNSWSLVSGDLSQERVNEIGQDIEAYYRSKPL